MSELLHVSSSPHVRSKTRTSNLMLLVVIALLPTTIAGILNFGWRALCLILISVVTCVAAEAIYEKLIHKKCTINDFSAVITGLLLALNLPASAPWWIPILGGVFAILVVKQLFGGLGQNFMNPALAARCFLLLSFTQVMTDFTPMKGVTNLVVDEVSGATALAVMKEGRVWEDIRSLFFGNIAGTIGETSAAAILLGAAFLLVMRVIDFRIPLTYIGTFLVYIIIFGGHGLDVHYMLAQLFGGGLMLGAWFMATDYVTTPITKSGQLVYGVILGLLTGLFRIQGASAEGVSYAIIISNLLIPLIERVTIPAAFGRERKKGGKCA